MAIRTEVASVAMGLPPDPRRNQTASCSSGGSVLLFLAEFLEARIVSQRIEHQIEPEQRGVNGPAGKAPAYGIENSFCKAAMARFGSSICAATRARNSI